MNNRLLLAGLIVLFVVGLTFFVRNMEQGASTTLQNTGSVAGVQANAGVNAVSGNNYGSDDDDHEDDDDYDDDDYEYGDDDYVPSSVGTATTVTTTTGSANSVTLEMLSAHSAKTDCWVAYDGKVYDLTSWLPAHPGSSARIEPYCGTASEFQEAFEGQHRKSQVNRLMQVGVFMGDFDVIGSLE